MTQRRVRGADGNGTKITANPLFIRLLSVGGVGGLGRNLSPHTPHTPHTHSRQSFQLFFVPFGADGKPHK
ncbi:hypothetical protein [Nostoc sphaeroides]|uniref:hypothetical protein n=1 Tax=Nostoc sphaeroides TaxID=446679 RepID=UPI00126A439B|nr:hypothetical protein [Nostoc sphaeroides]